MRTIQRFVTYDGQEHQTQEAALRHLDEKHGSLVCLLAHRLVQDARYSHVVNVLDSEETLAVFRDLIHVADDRILIDET